MKLTETEKKILKTVAEEARTTPKLIAKKLKLSEQHVRNLVSNLYRFGFLKRVTRGLYEPVMSKYEEFRLLGEKARSIHARYGKKK
ncbi:MAG: winged helix-turn-helix transcriptional regulator [Candidatus Helarchaeota archaeon]